MRFEVLGPIAVHADGSEVIVTGRQRSLLATLLVHANQLVDVERLVDAIWGDTPPRDARNQLQGCVSRLRRQLAAPSSRYQLIVTDPAGYRLKVDEGSVDLLEFRRLVARARTAVAQGHRRDALDAYREALQLWRGPALAGVESDRLSKIAAALDEERLRAIEERVQLELALGGAGELVPELTDLVAQHRYREGFHGALMLALHRAGRSAEALAAYQRAHSILVEEIGTEPGAALRELHQRILSEDRDLLSPTVGASDVGGSARHSLPRALDDFTGRPDAVAKLVEAAQTAVAGPVVLAIDGMAGIGKTTLAVHVAHILASRYPDAQLFIDLHGYSERRPVEPVAALDTLLRQLGVPSGRIPADLEDRMALWRSEMAERRALMVLDNASRASQVAPLLPAGQDCLVLVTSRRRLAGLDASRPLSLEVLTTEEAVALLAKIAGGRVHAELEAATEVAFRCGYLPLAIRLAGARLAHRSSWKVRDLADRLQAARGLLTELAVEDRTVADAFALSYAQLQSDLQRPFRLLSTHPGEDFDASTLAALADVALADSKHALDELVDHHLVDEPRPGRYCLHDLVKEYAHQLALSIDSEQERRAAIEGMLDFYLHATARTSGLLERPGTRQRFHPGEPIRQDLLDGMVGQSVNWLEEERSNLAAVVRCATAAGFEGYAWRLARAAWRFLYHRGYLDDLVETHRMGLIAAERANDSAAVAIMCNYLASAHHKLGNLDQAAELVQRSFGLWLELGDRRWAAVAKMNLGAVYRRLGRLEQAIRLYQEALAVQQRLGDLDGMGICFQNLGLDLMYLGRYAESIQCIRRSLAIARQVGDLAGCANELGDLGAVRLRLGEYEVAIRLLAVARAVHSRVGSREHLADVINNLGVLRRVLGEPHEATRLHREALAMAQDIGETFSVLAARNELGQTLLALGDSYGALEEHRRALAEASKIKLKYEHARALYGIAACLASTQPEVARSHWLHALRLYREMGVPEQADVERHLRRHGWAEDDPHRGGMQAD